MLINAFLSLFSLFFFLMPEALKKKRKKMKKKDELEEREITGKRDRRVSWEALGRSTGNKRMEAALEKHN